MTMPGTWWNSRQNTTLEDDDYARQAAAILQAQRDAEARQEQYERLVAEGYYDDQD